MSWSVSAAAPRDKAIQHVRDQLHTSKGNYLPPAEGERADKILDTIEEFAKSSVAPTDVLKISAWGSESTAWDGGTADPTRIVSIQGGYNVTVERPVPTEPTATASAA